MELLEYAERNLRCAVVILLPITEINVFDFKQNVFLIQLHIIDTKCITQYNTKYIPNIFKA